jgi:hypothetical protein
MNEKLRIKLAGEALMSISNYCDKLEDIQEVIDEMNVLHNHVMKEQHDLLGGQL